MEFPGMVTRMIIADISPGSYLNNGANNHLKVHEKIIDAMLKVDLDRADGLSGIEANMAKHLPDKRIIPSSPWRKGKS